MNSTFAACAADALRDTQLFLHPTETPLHVLQGTAEDEIELTAYVSECSQTPHELSFT